MAGLAVTGTFAVLLLVWSWIPERWACWVEDRAEDLLAHGDRKRHVRQLHNATRVTFGGFTEAEIEEIEEICRLEDLWDLPAASPNRRLAL